jgi:hypothetical protein
VADWRPVDAHEEERHAARAGPLERREPVRDGLEADAEAPPQQVDVVPQFFGGPEEPAVREDERAREVVREADPGQAARLVPRQVGGVDFGADEVVARDEREVRGELERPLPGAQQGREPQDAGLGVEAALDAVLFARFEIGDDRVVLLAQEAGEPAREVAAFRGTVEGRLLVDPFGRLVE